MIPRIAFAVFVSIGFAAGVANAACPQDHPKTPPAKAAKERAQAGNCVDLDTVPQISAHIVAAEPVAQPAKTPAYSLPAAGQYEGPTLGLSKPQPSARPAPTIGYRWSLE